MSIQDNYLKTTDGYFARLTPSLDSVEEVTVTTAGNTADATGQGSVQVKFVTKSGIEHAGPAPPTSTCGTTRSTRTPGSATATCRRIRRRARRRRTSCAATSRASRRAGRSSRTRRSSSSTTKSSARRRRARCSASSLSPEAVGRHLQLQHGGGVAAVNLLQLAAANGQLATPDPMSRRLLADIQATACDRQRVAAVESARAAVHVVDADARASIRRRPSVSTTS